jgi:hypothetical protein
MGDTIIDELMGALKYDTSLIDGRGVVGADVLSAPEMSPVPLDESAADCCEPAPQSELAAKA